MWQSCLIMMNCDARRTDEHQLNTDIGSMCPLKHGDIKHPGARSSCKQDLTEPTGQPGGALDTSGTDQTGKAGTALSRGWPSAHTVDAHAPPNGDRSTASCTTCAVHEAASRPTSVRSCLQVSS